VAAAAIATLKHASTGEPQKKADALAERTRQGLRRILSDLKIAGVVYGASSTFHVYFGEVPSGGIAALSAQQIRSVPKSIVTAIRHGLRNHGIEFMSYLGGVTSGAHTEADIDAAVKAYRSVLERLVAERVLDQYVK
jgi:glutamate-1-semialdehyde 2,1-aminomutase